jgi:ABC-type branched-subunit amino acid transport system ATPase component
MSTRAEMSLPLDQDRGRPDTDGLVFDVRGISFSYGGVRAVSDVSLSLRPGTTTGLIGPNGAGKSTLLNIMSCFLKPVDGSVWLGPSRLSGRSGHVAARQGVVRTFQITNLFAKLTVLENPIVGAGSGSSQTLTSAFIRRGRWRREQQEAIDQGRALLARFGLEQQENNYGYELSGGQKRIVEIIRALMARPKVLLLDEPFAGLSPTIIDQMIDHLVGECEKGLTLLVVEHELSLVERMCQTVAVMADGKMLAQGPMSALRANEEVRRAYLD